MNRRSSGRRTHVDFPIGIRRVGDVDSDAGKAMGLFPIPCAGVAEAKPAASHKQPLVAIDVKALMRCPTSRSAVFFKFGGSQLVPVRKDMALDSNGAVIGGVLSGRR